MDQHPILEEGGDLLLGPSNLDKLQRFLQGLLRDALGSDEVFNLRRLLDRTQLLQQLRCRDQLLALQLFLPAVVLPDGGIRLLKAQPLDVVLFNHLVGQRRHGGLDGALPDLRACDGLAGGFDVAAVREEVAPAAGDNRHPCAGAELGGVQPVGCARHHHGVQVVGVQLLRDLMESAHFSCISFLRSI